VQFYLTRRVDCGFAEAVERATAALKAEGFGILTEIDVQATLHDKLGAEFRPYKILGACNAPLAQQALAAEPYIGALMPCNVFVQQAADGQVEVSVMNPATLVPITGNTGLQAVQDEVTARIGRVLAAL
jgi:uncharacterized protein (DUF302 family)